MLKRVLVTLILASMVCGLVPPAWTSSLAAMAVPGHARHGHSCCPAVSPGIDLAGWAQPVLAKLPCGGTLPCCVQPLPQNSPSLPAASRVLRPDSRGIPLAIEHNPLPGVRWALATGVLGRSAFDFYSVRSTVLRN